MLVVLEGVRKDIENLLIKNTLHKKYGECLHRYSSMVKEHSNGIRCSDGYKYQELLSCFNYISKCFN